MLHLTWDGEARRILLDESRVTGIFLLRRRPRDVKLEDSDPTYNADINSDWIVLRSVEFSSKVLNVLPRRLPVGIAGIAVKLEGTSP